MNLGKHSVTCTECSLSAPGNPDCKRIKVQQKMAITSTQKMDITSTVRFELHPFFLFEKNVNKNIAWCNRCIFVNECWKLGVWLMRFETKTWRSMHSLRDYFGKRTAQQNQIQSGLLFVQDRMDTGTYFFCQCLDKAAKINYRVHSERNTGSKIGMKTGILAQSRSVPICNCILMYLKKYNKKFLSVWQFKIFSH